MNIDTEKLRLLLQVLKEEEVSEFEHEDKDVKLRVVRGAVVVASAPAHPVAAPAQTSASIAPPAGADLDTVDVTSPFVGTFYRAPSPEVPPFVDVGSIVRPGQTLCIVEAMKLMNEIEAEVSGTIVEVLVQNGKSVEFGQKLFRVKKA